MLTLQILFIKNCDVDPRIGSGFMWPLSLTMACIILLLLKAPVVVSVIRDSMYNWSRALAVTNKCAIQNLFSSLKDCFGLLIVQFGYVGLLR